MTVENSADRAAFVSTDDFAVAAVYTPQGGDPVAVSLILDRPHEIARIGDMGALERAHTARLRADDVANPAEGDTLTVDVGSPDLQFTVLNARSDVTGDFWILDLRLDS